MSTTLAPTAAAPVSAPAPRGWRRFFDANNRFLPPLLISCILLTGQLTYGMLESWRQTFLSIGTCIVVELVVSRWLKGKWPHLASAYISGISVGILVRSPFYWPFALCAAVTILSKYVLRWRGIHLWNPSNFGVSALFFLYPAAAASLSIQWGNTLWPMIVIWCLGAIIIGRLKRFHICASYVATFVVLSLVRSAITGKPWFAAVAPLTGPMYQLFVFFMITDPPTTVKNRTGQCVVAALVAVVEMLFRLGEEVHAPYYALFLVGPTARIVEQWMLRRSGSGRDAAPVPSPAAAS